MASPFLSPLNQHRTIKTYFEMFPNPNICYAIHLSSLSFLLIFALPLCSITSFSFLFVIISLSSLFDYPSILFVYNPSHLFSFPSFLFYHLSLFSSLLPCYLSTPFSVLSFSVLFLLIFLLNSLFPPLSSLLFFVFLLSSLLYSFSHV